MAQVRFTVSDEAAAYLRWLGDEIVLEKTIDSVAKHILMQAISDIRRENKDREPNLAELLQRFPDT